MNSGRQIESRCQDFDRIACVSSPNSGHEYSFSTLKHGQMELRSLHHTEQLDSLSPSSNCQYDLYLPDISHIRLPLQRITEQNWSRILIVDRRLPTTLHVLTNTDDGLETTGRARFEHATIWLKARRSAGLSYRPYSPFSVVADKRYRIMIVASQTTRAVTRLRPHLEGYLEARRHAVTRDRREGEDRSRVFQGQHHDSREQGRFHHRC